jgi:phosphotransferase system HPr-like phosphotransfer protein
MASTKETKANKTTSKLSVDKVRSLQTKKEEVNSPEKAASVEAEKKKSCLLKFQTPDQEELLKEIEKYAADNRLVTSKAAMELIQKGLTPVPTVQASDSTEKLQGQLSALEGKFAKIEEKLQSGLSSIRFELIKQFQAFEESQNEVYVTPIERKEQKSWLTNIFGK